MYERILVPTDGSDHAIRAAEHALWLSRAFDATLHVINAVDVVRAAGPFDAGGLDEEFLDRLEGEGRETVESTVSAIDAVNEVRTDVVRGRPSEAICEYVEGHAIDLVAMGTHGRSGLRRYVVGSVAERVVRRSDVPVYTVRATDRSRMAEGYDEVLIPTDGSEHAALAAEHGVAIAATSNARVHVLNVIDVGAAATTPEVTAPPSLVEALESAGTEAAKPVAERASDAGLDVTTAVRDDYPAGGILAYADENDVDLLAMGTAGRTGLGRFVLGSTAETVVNRAEMPVFSVTASDRES